MDNTNNSKSPWKVLLDKSTGQIAAIEHNGVMVERVQSASLSSDTEMPWPTLTLTILSKVDIEFVPERTNVGVDPLGNCRDCGCHVTESGGCGGCRS